MRRALPLSVISMAIALWCGPVQGQDGGTGQRAPSVDAGPLAEAGSGSDAGEVATLDADPWCPAGIETLGGSVCAVVPDPVASPRTLVIFLHGVVQPGSGWQHNPIRGMAAAARRMGFALLAPRGRRGVARAELRDYWAWPTSSAAQAQHEAEVLEEWASARRALEERSGSRFDKVLVFGFSSGAYYASSLALRGKLTVDGYGVFAGGAAPYPPAMMARVRNRAPMFVGYGLKDKAGSKDARKLVAALRALRWKHRELPAPRAGHTLTDAQLRQAVLYLRGR